MSRLRKVYVPKWAARFGLAALVLMWLWVTYEVHFGPTAGSDLGVGGWLVMTAVMGAMAVLFVLLGNRTLPVYLVELEDEEGE